jgi:hypothetical protein
MVSKLIFFRQNKLEVFVFLFHLQLVLERDLQHRDDVDPCSSSDTESSGTDTESSGTESGYIGSEDDSDAVEDRNYHPQVVSTCYYVVSL